MSKCKKCNIEILDDTRICPLCNGVIKVGHDEVKEVDKKETEQTNKKTDKKNKGTKKEKSDENVSKSLMYPDVSPRYKVMNFVTKLVIFLAILTEAILMIINYVTYNGVKWSLICGAGLAYCCSTMVYNFIYNRGHRRTIMFQAVGAIILCVLIDFALGFQGWSISFAMPITVIAVAIGIVVMMIVNYNTFQFYMMMMVYNFLISIICLIIIIVSPVISFAVLAIIAAAFSGFLLVGTLLFGDKPAMNELTRRFRV